MSEIKEIRRGGDFAAMNDASLSFIPELAELSPRMKSQMSKGQGSGQSKLTEKAL